MEYIAPAAAPGIGQRVRPNSAFPIEGRRGATIDASGLRLPARILPHGEEHHETSLSWSVRACSSPPRLSAQQGPPKSPPATESATIAGKAITITYSSPGVKGRAGHIFGKDGLIGHDPTYPVWRAGANSATKLHTEADLTLGGLNVPKGDYTLFVDVSDPDNWVLIVNKQTGQWGTIYDKTQDLGRVKMSMEKPPALVENLKYTIAALGGTTASSRLEWENHSASVLIAVH